MPPPAAVSCPVRPRAVAHVEQFTDLFRVEPRLFRRTLHLRIQLFLPGRYRALHDGFGKHLKVGGRDFQLHVRALFDQTFYGYHKYRFLNFVMTIFKKFPDAPLPMAYKKKHRRPSGKKVDGAKSICGLKRIDI